MTIGIIMVGVGIGDAVVALKALCECKKIYNAKVIVFGSGSIESLFQTIDFVDEIVNIGGLKDGILDESHIAIMKPYFCDYVILAVPKTHNFKILKQCNVKKIVMQTKLTSLVSLKTKNVYFRFWKNYKEMSLESKICALVRSINPKLYDSKISSFDSNNMRIQTTLQHKAFIAKFLESETKKLIESSLPLDNNAKENQLLHNQEKYYILVNPFSITALWILNPNSWLNLILQLSHIKDSILVIPTYEAVHDNFIQNLKEFQKTSNNNQEIPNLIIFKNNNDILNLVALVEQMSLVIAPSTGTIHIASNLDIPTIGIYSQADTKKWKSKDERYVILKKPKHEITPQEEEEVIAQAVALTKELLEQKALQSKVF